jgi:predicted DNA-binding transcriptional regulator AlpA
MLACSGADPLYLRITGACLRSGLSRSRVYALLSEGRLRARKEGATTLVEWLSVAEYLDSLPLADFGRARRRPV